MVLRLVARYFPWLLLCRSIRHLVRRLHHRYLAAGADIISTNTFSSTTVAQREYGLDDPALIHDLNVAGARLAREMADDAQQADGRPRWVAGALGRR